MERNLFIQLCKYKVTEFVTPLENFCTESLVYLIEHLLNCEKNIRDEILQLFGIDGNKKTTIETQVAYYIKNNNQNYKLIPDIHIIADNSKHILIEVKVDSSLHESKIGYKDQLDDYCHLEIEGQKCEVYSLTKFDLSTLSIDLEYKKKWSDIYKILTQAKDTFAIQFREFMEDNDMEGFEALEFDISKIKSEQSNFNDILKQAFEKSDFANTYILEGGYILADGNGWYVNKNNNNDNSHFWFGIIPNRKSFVSKILFEVLQSIKENYKEICSGKDRDVWGNIIINELNLNEILTLQSREKQIEKIKNWLNDVNKKIST